MSPISGSRSDRRGGGLGARLLTAAAGLAASALAGAVPAPQRLWQQPARPGLLRTARLHPRGARPDHAAGRRRLCHRNRTRSHESLPRRPPERARPEIRHGQRPPDPQSAKCRRGSAFCARAPRQPGARFAAPPDAGQGPIAAIHTSEYLVFLETIHARWQRMPDAGDEVIPNVHPAQRTRQLSPLRRRPGRLAPGRHRLSHRGGHLGVRLLVGADRHRRRRCRRRRHWPVASAPVYSGVQPVYALCRPPGTTPSPIWPADSAFSTMPPSPRKGCCRTACGRRSWTWTCTTATARRAFFTSVPMYLRSRSMPIRCVSIRSSGATPMNAARGPGLGANLNLPLPRGTDDAGFWTPSPLPCNASALMPRYHRHCSGS